MTYQTITAEPTTVEPSSGSDLDPRLTFLERADALLILIEAAELSVDEAFDRLTPAIYEFAGCRCYREIIEHFDEAARDSDHCRDHHRDDHDLEDTAYPSRAAASTVEALEYELRAYGIDHLKKPRAQARLAHLNAEQMADMVASLRRMQPRYPAISNELISFLQGLSK